MDNDNKIDSKDLAPAQRHKDVLLFLNDELNNLQTNTTAQTYNLEKEYAKTKKHKSPFIFLLLFICFLLVFGVAFIMTKTIQKQNEKITVNLEEFEDLNLKSLLDAVTKVQDKYDNCIKQIEIYKVTMDSLLKEAESKRDDDLFVISTMEDVDETSLASKKREINREYQNKIAQIKNEYLPKIRELEEQAESYKQELDTYDADTLENAKEKEKIVDAERQLQNIERQKLVDMYERRINQLQAQLKEKKKTNNLRSAVSQVTGKYSAEMNKLDPIIKDEKANKIVNDERFKIVKTFSSDFIIRFNSIEDDYVLNKFSEYQSLYDNYKYLMSFVEDVPQKNTIPMYVNASEKLVDKMGESYSQTVIDLSKQKDKLEKDNQDLQNQILKLDDDYKKNVAELDSEYQQRLNNLDLQYKKTVNGYNSCIDQMLNLSNHNAVVVSCNSKDSIYVYVIPRARYLVDSKNAKVEIYGTKVVSGSLQKTNDTYYKFIPQNGAGYEIDFNLRDIIPGAIVKFVE